MTLAVLISVAPLLALLCALLLRRYPVIHLIQQGATP